MVSIEANIHETKIIFEGLWKTCVVQGMDQMQCKDNDFDHLPPYLKAACVLLVISVIVSVFGVILGITGGKCSKCVREKKIKSKIAMAGGMTLISAGILCLVPLCWTAVSIFFESNPIFKNKQWDMGLTVLIGFCTSALLLLGGAVLSCGSCPPKEIITEIKYIQPSYTIINVTYI
ncbi:claudin-like protein ZF-A89 [Chanos chanos]|uniref:Claudin n=1 Tax=Chanos chanos TaxID=29144 RepID=A0A6J2VRS5_CHACN|nr:claudin-like protein ZF-A89 [Chanos chanos]